MGCADPPSEGVGAPHQCSRVNQKNEVDGWSLSRTSPKDLVSKGPHTLRRLRLCGVAGRRDLRVDLCEAKFFKCIRAVKATGFGVGWGRRRREEYINYLKKAHTNGRAIKKQPWVQYQVGALHGAACNTGCS